MNDDQFNRLLAMVTVVAYNSAVSAAQAVKREQLTDSEIDECQRAVDQTAELLFGKFCRG